MGWLTIVLLALALAAALWPFVRKDRGALQFLVAALLLALAGYSWQGRPDQPGSPKAEQERRALPDDDFAILHPDLLGRFDRAYSWITLADGDRRSGNMLGGAQVLESAIRANPRNYALWTAYAYALVAANDNLMSPASQLAFERAYRLAPNHPAPVFTYGLALARGGNWDQAEQVWREQLQGLGPNFSLYRAAIEDRLAAIREARQTGVPVRPATPPRPAPGQGAPPAAPTAGVQVAPTPPGNSNAN